MAMYEESICEVNKHFTSDGRALLVHSSRYFNLKVSFRVKNLI